jgi:lysozyme family protein
MLHPFVVLKPEYTNWLATVKVTPTRQKEVVETAARLITYKPHYAEVSAKTGIPIVWLATVGEREDGANIFHSYFGNGDPLTHPTRDVPRGRGPFPNFIAGLYDSLSVDKIDQIKDWSWERNIYEWIVWNGAGYDEHGEPSPYVVGGTNLQRKGKYTADGHYDATSWDTQLGCLPVALEMVKQDPSLQFDTMPVPMAGPLPSVGPPPVGLGGGDLSTTAIQTALNKLVSAGIQVDGNYGRQTRRAVMEFQRKNGLDDDGLVGPLTEAKLKEQLA